MALIASIKSIIYSSPLLGADLKTCVCKWGYTEDGSGKCVKNIKSTCKDDEEYDETNDVCVKKGLIDDETTTPDDTGGEESGGTEGGETGGGESGGSEGGESSGGESGGSEGGDSTE